PVACARGRTRASLRAAPDPGPHRRRDAHARRQRGRRHHRCHHSVEDDMLLLHEVHTVAGRHEEAFEDAFREGWMPTLGKTDDARLLYYLKLAHGTGRAYFHVSITGLRDGNAYADLAERVQRGDLRSWAADVDRYRHEVKGKILLPVEWSPF